MHTQPRPDESLDLSDVVPLSAFYRECEEKKVASKGQLSWWVRYRHENGLAACGAIVEKRANPKSKRPMLFAVRPKFVGWLTASGE